VAFWERHVVRLGPRVLQTVLGRLLMLLLIHGYSCV
jgi:hypothetical protein